MPSFYKRGAAVFGALTVLGAVVFATLTTTTLKIGTGKQLSNLTSATSSLDFASITNGSCSGTTMTVTGATTSTNSPNSVVLGLPQSLVSGYATHTTWSAYVSATDTVTVRGCAGTSTAMSDPPALVFRATILDFNP